MISWKVEFYFRQLCWESIFHMKTNALKIFVESVKYTQYSILPCWVVFHGNIQYEATHSVHSRTFIYQSSAGIEDQLKYWEVHSEEEKSWRSYRSEDITGTYYIAVDLAACQLKGQASTVAQFPAPWSYDVTIKKKTQIVRKFWNLH